MHICEQAWQKLLCPRSPSFRFSPCTILPSLRLSFACQTPFSGQEDPHTAFLAKSRAWLSGHIFHQLPEAFCLGVRKRPHCLTCLMLCVREVRDGNWQLNRRPSATAEVTGDPSGLAAIAGSGE